MGGAQSWVEILHCLHNHGSKIAKDVFAGYVTGKGLIIIDSDKKKFNMATDEIDPAHQGEIAQIRSTEPESRFVLVGIPQTSSFISFAFNKASLTLSLQKRINIEGFRTFETDSLGT